MTACGLATAVALSPTAAAPSDRVGAASTLDPLLRLLAGNRRFVTGAATHPRQGPADVRRLGERQHPYAITLACADSRVPPEILFDHGLGDILDIRVAGHVVDDVVLGSIEYALAEFEPSLLIVLGHERCGAVEAAVDAIRTGGTPPGHVAAVVDALRPAIVPALAAPGDAIENGVRANVAWQLRTLWERSTLVRRRVASGALTVVGARYDLDTATVTLLTRGR
jgi:carbonic anhydrase